MLNELLESTHFEHSRERRRKCFCHIKVMLIPPESCIQSKPDPVHNCSSPKNEHQLSRISPGAKFRDSRCVGCSNFYHIFEGISVSARISVNHTQKLALFSRTFEGRTNLSDRMRSSSFMP